ncbi:MAG: hypothetical protein E7283_09180 [Lachnospiraceae bacterium]|nr:hypothetical protein [Lachnospiraceae bacterium]
MEKRIVWYQLFLKQNIKKPTTWIMFVLMLGLLWIVANIHIPDGTNHTIMVCYQDSSYEKEIENLLKNSKTEFEFVSVENADEVYSAVEKGRAECGFVLSEDFDRQIEKGKWKEIVFCYTSPFGTKTEVAKENFFAAMFPIYSKWLLTTTEGDIYKKTNAGRMEELLEKHDAFLGGELMLSFEEIRVDGTEVVEEKANSIYPLQGLVELFVLLAMLLAAGGYGQKETAQIESALLIKEKIQFRYIYLLASGTLTAVIGFVAILFTTDSRGVLIEFISILGLLVVGAFGVMIFSKLFKNRLTYLSWVATFVFGFLLLRFGVAGYITH